MKSPLIPAMLFMTGLIGLASLFSIKVPKVVIDTYMTPSILKAVEPEILLDYSTRTVSCTGVSPSCFVQVSPYTYTATWSGQTTPILPISVTTTTLVAYALNGSSGSLAVFFALVLLTVSIVLVARNHWRNKNKLRTVG